MIAHLISSKLTRKLLTHYFSHPEEKFYVRELATLLNLFKIGGVTTSTIHEFQISRSPSIATFIHMDQQKGL